MPRREGSSSDEETILLDESGKEDKAAERKLLKRPRLLDWSMDWWWAWSLSRRIIVSAVTLIVIATAIVLAVIGTSGKKTHSILDLGKHKKPAANTVASPLTGAQVDPALAQRPVTGIMIENSPDARPQSGLQDAGVVFEAIAEGGITRFLALYQEARPQYIGPVRSLRPYYIDWAGSFDASIAHVGGSLDALADIRNGGKDLDQFFNDGSFWRQSTRPSPHNVYTSFDKLDALNQSKGYTSSKFDPWTRKTDKKLATPTAKSIDISISGPTYSVRYDYDGNTNTYFRSEGGASHNYTTSAEDKTGAELHPKVVIAMVMSYAILDDAGHSAYGTFGSGTVYVFQDGGVTQGTWAKSSRNGQFVLTDSQNHALALNAGQTWITVIQGGDLNYAP